MKKHILFTLFIACIFNAAAQTNVSGGIYSNTTWTLAGSPYIVTDTLIVFQSVKLTIEPGVEVQFDNNVIMEVWGSVYAVGTLTDTITFGSSSITPYAGIYKGIVTNYSSDSCTFRYCKFSDAYSAFISNNSNPPFSHCSFISNLIGVDVISGVNQSYDSCLFEYDSSAIGPNTLQGNVQSCEFRHNSIAIDGSIFGGGSLALIANSVFENNEYGTKGLSSGGPITQCIFDSNDVADYNSVSSPWSISNCVFKYNMTGVEELEANITNNTISNNTIGIISYSSNISMNTISANTIGIETNDDVITCNSICGNTQYSIVAEMANNELADYNYWCLPDSAHIQATIYDAYQNINYGFVFFTPFDVAPCAPGCNLTVTASATNSVVCSGDSTTLNANISDFITVHTAVWNPGSYTGNTFHVNPITNTTYTVVVTDSMGCTAIAYVTVDTACAHYTCSLSVTASATFTTVCSGDTTTLSAHVTDANPVYTAVWNPGSYTGITYSVTPMANTTYTVVVTDSSGCTNTAFITIDTSCAVTPPTCNLTVTTSSTYSTVCIGDTTTLTAHVTDANPVYTAVWNPGSFIGITYSVTPVSNTTYTAVVTDSSGCTATSTVSVFAISCVPPDPCSSFDPPSICYVTTDTSSTFNTVVWQKTGMDTVAIDSIIIYRLNDVSIYVPINEQSVHAFSTYNDYTARPLVEPSFYRLGIHDTCGGIDTTLSNFNETVFLQSVSSGPSTVNLIWNFYQGSPVNYYRILRDDSGTGNWHAIDSVNGLVNAYTDRSAPVNPGLRYLISIDWNVVCTPSIIKPRHGSRYVFGSNGEYSNVTKVFPTGIVNISDNGSIKVYPNPVNDAVSISFGNAFDGIVKITDVLGQDVYTSTISADGGSVKKISLSNLANGVYFITLQGKGMLYRTKIIKM